MNCNWCGVYFEPTQVEQKYCSSTHSKSFQKHRSKLNKRGLSYCPQPFKKAFGTRGAAIVFAYENKQEFYDCVCGAYHITSLAQQYSCHTALENYERSLMNAVA
jgi:hypothetical protein